MRGRPSSRPTFPTTSELWLLRHGETEWSASGKHTGRTDVPLTEHGEKQAEAMRGMLGDLQPALVLCSPRSRAQDTARLAGFADVEIDDDLVEWDYGAYEGRTTDEIRETSPGWDLFTARRPRRRDRGAGHRARRPGADPRRRGAGRAARSCSSATGTSAGRWGRGGSAFRCAAALTCCWAPPRRRNWACTTASP